MAGSGNRRRRNQTEGDLANDLHAILTRDLTFRDRFFASHNFSFSFAFNFSGIEISPKVELEFLRRWRKVEEKGDVGSGSPIHFSRRICPLALFLSLSLFSLSGRHIFSRGQFFMGTCMRTQGKEEEEEGDLLGRKSPFSSLQILPKKGQKVLSSSATGFTFALRSD